MAEPKRRLGRGLDSLLSSTRLKEIDEVAGDPAAGGGGVAVAATVATPAAPASLDEMVLQIPVGLVTVNPHQPRRQWDEQRLNHLAESIQANGLIQPIIVRKMGDGYQLIAGERRLRATRIAGRPTILAVVRHASEQQVVEWALVENIHRDDLNPMERAHAYRHYVTHFSLTQEQAAQKLGEDRATLSNYMRLLELPEEVRALVAGGRLSMGHARALLGVSDEKALITLARLIVEKSLSVREAEKRVQAQDYRAPAPDEAGPDRKPHIAELERELSRTLGTKVTIKPQGKRGHRGKIVIDFYNLDDFDRIRGMLQ